MECRTLQFFSWLVDHKHINSECEFKVWSTWHSHMCCWKRRLLWICDSDTDRRCFRFVHCIVYKIDRSVDRNREIAHTFLITSQTRENKIIRINYITLRMGMWLSSLTCRNKVIDYYIKIGKFLNFNQEK